MLESLRSHRVRGDNNDPTNTNLSESLLFYIWKQIYHVHAPQACEDSRPTCLIPQKSIYIHHTWNSDFE